jgi:hypothetical protein
MGNDYALSCKVLKATARYRTCQLRQAKPQEKANTSLASLAPGTSRVLFFQQGEKDWYFCVLRITSEDVKD